MTAGRTPKAPVPAAYRATSAETYDLLGVGAKDRDAIAGREVDEAAVSAAAALLRRRIGTFPGRLDPVSDDEYVAIAAYLETVDDVRRYHARLGVPRSVTRATLGDLGRVLALNRVVHGRFGADVHAWLGWHWAGSLYELGRLQYLLRPGDETAPAGPVPGVGPGEWVLDLHIPESGPLTPAAIDRSLAEARAFFVGHFPDKPVRTAICASWLLDPYLSARLPADSNIVRFARRFTPYAEPRDVPTDAVYFTFRTRDMSRVDRLPRRTALQRVVIDRITAGGAWQVGFGMLAL